VIALQTQEQDLAMAEDTADRGAGGELMEQYGNFYTACRAARC